MKKKAARMIVTMMLMALAAVSSVRNAAAFSASEIDSGVDRALNRFYTEVHGGEKLAKDAKGVLVFPAVFKAGIGLGGEYGEGALRVKGKTVDYYSTAAASLGLQLGAQKKAIIILFMQKDALEKFRMSSGWKAGVDASIAVVTVGAGGEMDTAKLKEPVIGFIFGQAGLMYNLTLEGAKITKLSK